MFYRRDPGLEQLIEDYCEPGEPHERLADFEIAGMFARPNAEAKTKEGDDVPARGACVNVRGRPAIAYAKRNSPRDVAQGASHAVIVVDEWRWDKLTDLERKAVIDHELTHLEVDRAKGRIVMRQHDFEVGWFEAVAARHGESSQERIQARALLSTPAAQLYFPGMEPDGTEEWDEINDSAVNAGLIDKADAEESKALLRAVKRKFPRKRPQITEASHGESA